MGLAVETEVKVGRALGALSRGLAYLGGVLLVGIACMVVVSIIGRRIDGVGPIRGDYELVEAGVAIAVFAFLPWCQLQRRHVTVDLLVDRLGPRIRAIFGVIGDLLVTGLAALIAWRFYLGFGEKFPYFSDVWRDRLGMGYKPFYPETTYELEIPIWMLHGLALIGAWVFVIVSAYTVWRSVNWTMAGAEPAETAKTSRI
ncbi:TRAP transporter small permease [Aestuariibius insulae]|uniref:TRAP transporter small permease n=1 Tax=Aestuariibius insulae TaxID=2058287 RepID=UPI00345E6572